MRWPLVACLLLASLLPLAAEDWTTEDGKIYKNVTVVGQENDGVRITYDGGVGKIPYYELPVDIQKRFGQDIESLAEKKQAVDKAIEDAVRSAAAAEQMKPSPVEASGPNAVAPQVNATNGTTPQNVAPNMPAPENASGAMPGTSPSAPAGPAGGTATATTAPNGSPGPQTNAPPGNVAPKPAAAPGPHVAAPGTGHVGPIEGLPQLEEPTSPTPSPAGIRAAGGKPLELTVSTYTYNVALDVCYLDSPAIEVLPDPPPKSPHLGQGSSLTMRIVTEGRTPQAPDRFEVTFLSVGGDGGDLGMSTIVFNTDDTQVTVDEAAKKDSGTLPGGGHAVQYVSFYLESPQMHQMGNAKTLIVCVGANRYRVDPQGMLTLRSYVADVDTLAPASSSFMRSFYKLLARIPSFFDMISTFCEYFILGSFALLVAVSIAAVILGISRFIKM